MLVCDILRSAKPATHNGLVLSMFHEVNIGGTIQIGKVRLLHEVTAHKPSISNQSRVGDARQAILTQVLLPLLLHFGKKTSGQWRNCNQSRGKDLGECVRGVREKELNETFQFTIEIALFYQKAALKSKFKC